MVFEHKVKGQFPFEKFELDLKSHGFVKRETWTLCDFWFCKQRRRTREVKACIRTRKGKWQKRSNKS